MEEATFVFARRSLAPRLGFLPRPGGFLNKTSKYHLGAGSSQGMSTRVWGYGSEVMAKT